METIIMVGQLLLGLTILVGIHEWGHMAAARMFGMRVEKFYIGFPPKVVSKVWKGTEYAIGAIPLGGFVKISGMMDESMDTESLAKEPEEWEFRAKPAWQRLIVMLGGIIMNVILGIIIFVVIAFVNGETYLSKEELNKDGIVAYKLGQKIGFQNGDKILDISGKDYETFGDLLSPNVLVGSNVYYTVQRGEDVIKIELPNNFIEEVSSKQGRAQVMEPRYSFEVSEVSFQSAKDAGLEVGDKFVSMNNTPINFYDEFQTVVKSFKGKTVSAVVKGSSGQREIELPINEESQVGFTALKSGIIDKYVTKELGFGESVRKGVGNAFSVVWLNVKGIGKIFSGDVSVTKSLSGPIRIATMFGTEWQWGRFWYLVGLLSMVLAFMNLLPIPALDGGHVVFLTWEIVTGRKPGDKFMEYAQKVGMIILLSLMAFVIFNDALQLVMDKWFR